MLSANPQHAFTSFIAILFMSLAACAPHAVEIKARKPEQSIPEFSVAGPVQAVTTQTPRNRVFKKELIIVDYQQLAVTAVQALNAALDRNEPDSAVGEPKSLVYAISSIDCFGGFGACFINFTIQTNDGRIRGFMSEGKGFLLTTSLSKAAANTSAVVFADPLILDYLAH